MKLPETHSIIDLGRKDDAAHTGAVDDTTSAMGYSKQVVTNTESIIATLGGSAIQMRTSQSVSTGVEEDGIQQFSISIMDVDTGAVATANIDITGIVSTIEKSTGGAAFSDAGLTAITFGKDDGRVFIDYQFLAAEWAVGDVYKISVSGIEADVGGDTAFVPAMVWSNFVSEDADLASAVSGIQTDLDNATDGLGALKILIDANQTDIDAVIVDTTAIIADLDNATDGLSALKALIDTVDSEVGGIQTDTTAIIADLDNATDGLSALKALIDIVDSEVGGVQTDTTAIIADLDNATDGLGALKVLIDTVDSEVGGIQTDTTAIIADLDNATDGLSALKGLIDSVQTDTTAIIADLDNATDGLSALKALIDTATTDIGGVQTDTTAIIADLDNATDGLGALKALLDAIPTTMVGTDNAATATDLATMQGNVTDILADTGTAGVVLGTKVAAYKLLAGEVQMLPVTADLNQAAASYDLMIGTAQPVFLTMLSAKMPAAAASGSVTSISIQTDDATPTVILSSGDGDVVNLTSEAELVWTGFARINVGTKIQITINGGANGTTYSVYVTARYEAIIDGGYLAE